MKKILLILLLFTTGCMNYRDLKEITIIKSIGISYQDEYHIYAQIIDDIDNDNKPIIKVVMAHDKNINNAFIKLQENIYKKTSFSHVDLLVLDKSLLKDNYQELINYFLYNNNFRNDFYCIISEDILSLFQNSEYDAIELFLKTNDKIPIQNFNKVMENYLNQKEVILPIIKYDKEIIYLGNFNLERIYNND